MSCKVGSRYAGPNWPLLGSIRRILSRVAASGYIFRLIFRSLSDVLYSDECRTKKDFRMSKNVTAFSCSGQGQVWYKKYRLRIFDYLPEGMSDGLDQPLLCCPLR